MTDIGAGVHERDEPPTNGRVGPGAPSDKLTCPACGDHDHAERSNHPSYPFLCGACWTLFTGTDLEWRRLRKHREAAIERRNNPPARLPPMRSHKTDRLLSATEATEENDDQ